MRNPRSPITLKPTAFCLLNNKGGVGQGQPNSGASTLPRAGAKSDGNPLEVKSCPTGTTFSQLPTQYEGDGSETPTLMSLTDSRNSIVTMSEMKDVEFPYYDFSDQGGLPPPEGQNSNPAMLSESGSVSGEIDADVYQDAEPAPPSESEGEPEPEGLAKAHEEERVNFTLGGDEEPLEILRNTVIPPDSGDFSALAPKKPAEEDEENTKKEEEPETDIPTQLPPVLDPSPQTQSSGAGSTSSASAESDAEKGQFIRQSSGQSDGSDEIPPLLHTSDLRDRSSPLPGQGDPPPGPLPVPHMTNYSLRYSSMSPPPVQSNGKKEMMRAHSVSSNPSSSSTNATRSLPRGRYNKRPLRGPYGEMLEAEMNKLIPVRATNTRDFDHFEIFRESKSSSPNRSSNSPHSNSPDETSAIPPPLVENPSSSNGASGISGKKLLTSLNPILMASMDDLNLTKVLKHTNPRSRKISANLPVSTSHYSGTFLFFAIFTCVFFLLTTSSSSFPCHSFPVITELKILVPFVFLRK